MEKGYAFVLLLILLSGRVLTAQSGMEVSGTGGGLGRERSEAVPPGSAGETPVPLKRIALFSSGVAYFEHQGAVSDSVRINLPFKIGAVNDALKSLVINDPHSPSPSVSYPSEETLYRTLKSLRIDLSENIDIAELLRRLTGEDIGIYTSSLIEGRILGVEYRPAPVEDRGSPTAPEAWLSLVTPQGIQAVGFKEISRFVFKDPGINADLNRALDLIRDSRVSDSRTLRVDLPGSSSRNISISYVIPAPVWKVSYRLDLSRDKPFLQGWAMVDNTGDIDWDGVELSLVTGRPVSFIQNLYPPHYVNRPVLPLAIAGAAEARTYDSGYVQSQAAGGSAAKARAVRADAAYEEMATAEMPVPAPNVFGGVMETAQAAAAGDQFEFTLRHPVNLPRQQSAMLPLIEGEVRVEKVLVFSGANAAAGGSVHPAIGAELTNTTGMRLPAGPVTVFDGGTYAGDALITFFPEGEKRLVSYGDDLTVNGMVSSSVSRMVSAVTVSRGVMTISRKLINEKVYVFKNNSREGKRLILEHPVIRNATLAEPSSFYERTDSLYRFALTLEAGGERTFTVKEETPLTERITLAQLGFDSLLSYVSNEEIPASVRAALGRGVELRQKIAEAETALSALEIRLTRLISEQDRIRRNLEAAGNQSTQGQEYLRRMAALDGEIDTLNTAIMGAEKNLGNAQNSFDDFLGSIDL
ncbi:MAG: DUF4139 domain-containing protein [Spirochaetaceae bacterium]|jgi:hypothetical protein|nr:DUF4139 domain-containing protein [Spirochaetaceae bacterium]